MNHLKDLLWVLSAIPSGFSTSEIEQLLGDHHGYLISILRFKTRDPDLAEDLAQETWLAFLASVPDKNRFKDPKALRNFLITIALNKLRDHFRRSGTRTRHVKSFSNREDLDRCIDGLESSHLGPEESFVNSQEQDTLDRCIAAAMESLAPLHAQALVLKFKENLSNSQIADKLGLGIKALESLLVRARQSFKKNLEKIALRENVILGKGVD